MTDPVSRPLPNALQIARMLDTMFELQETHNLQVAADWRSRGFAFHRAIWVECAELLDHYGWKWWKHQTPDLGQVRLEIVDIWHFGISCLMQDARFDVAALASAFNVAHEQAPLDARGEAFRQAVEAMAREALDGRFTVPTFVSVMHSLPMDFHELFELYVGKNVLNRFRQANGYASGEYRKLWHGREDNVHLLELAANLAPERTDYIEALHAALSARYHGTA